MKNIDGEIFVVDNNSADDSKNFFYDKFLQVKFIWNNENEGFAKACNKALQQASGDYILFLNPDTIVPENCFENCITFIQSKNNSIACGVKMIDGSGNFLKESKRSFPSPATSFYKLSGLALFFPRSKIFSKYHLGFLDKTSNHEVDVLSGAFMMVPKKIIEKVGAFDENFFMYGEDIDLSYRIQKAGYKNFYFAETTIIHFKGESTQKESIKYVQMFYKAMSIFVKKHYGGAEAGIFNFFIHTGIYLRAALSVMGRFILVPFNNIKKKTNNTNQILVIGSPQEFEEVEIYFKKNNSLKQMRLLQSATNLSAAINESVQLYSIDEIIFCEGRLTYKEIIQAIENLQHHFTIYFFNVAYQNFLETK